MPVFSLSRASTSAMTLLPPLRMSRRRSTSGWKPSRMKPPSRTEKGGSSTTARDRRAYASSSRSKDSPSSPSRPAGKGESFSFSSGSFPSAARRDAKSRPPALP